MKLLTCRLRGHLQRIKLILLDFSWCFWERHRASWEEIKTCHHWLPLGSSSVTEPMVRRLTEARNVNLRSADWMGNFTVGLDEPWFLSTVIREGFLYQAIPWCPRGACLSRAATWIFTKLCFHRFCSRMNMKIHKCSQRTLLVRSNWSRWRSYTNVLSR